MTYCVMQVRLSHRVSSTGWRFSELYSEVQIPRTVCDEVARSGARWLGRRLRGTLGILVKAGREKILTLVQTELLMHEISDRPDIWISSKLCEQVLSELRKR